MPGKYCHRSRLDGHRRQASRRGTGLQRPGLGRSGPAAGQRRPVHLRSAGQRRTSACGTRAAAGMLLGKIGENGTVFNVGERYSGMPDPGRQAVPANPPGNFGGGQQGHGSYRAKINAGLDIELRHRCTTRSVSEANPSTGLGPLSWAQDVGSCRCSVRPR